MVANEPLKDHEPPSATRSAYRGPLLDPPLEAEYLRLLNGKQTEDADSDLLDFLTDEEAENLPLARGILGEILFEASTGVFYGPSRMWKSFTALDWAMHVATGREWMGQPVKQGSVLYISAEGSRNLGKRIRAWKQHRNVQGSVPIQIYPKAVNFLKPEQVALLIHTIQQKMRNAPPILIIIDTLARSMAGGNENATPDTTQLIDCADTLRDAFGACVLFLHHTGYNQTHLRGNTVLFNNPDLVLHIETDAADGRPLPGDVVRIVSEKNRDHDPFATISATTELVEWADPTTGEAARSLVVVPCNDSDAHKKRKPPVAVRPTTKEFSRDAVKLWELLVTMTNAAPQGITFTDWQKAAADKLKMPRASFNYSRGKLADKEWITTVDALYQPKVPTIEGGTTVDFSE